MDKQNDIMGILPSGNLTEFKSVQWNITILIGYPLVI